MEATIAMTMGTEDRTTERIPAAAFVSTDPAVRSDAAERVGRTAYVFALQLTRSRDTAQDIAQEAVLRFYRNINRFDDRRPVEPWLYQIVRNQVRDHARKDGYRRHDSLDTWLDQGIKEPADDSSDPALIAEQHEQQRLVWSAIGRLSDDHREILVLRDFNDLSYDELAATLGIPRGTVMSRLHAARKKLRDQLVADMDDSEGGGGIDG